MTSKLRDYLELDEVYVVSAEKANWRKIEPNMDNAIRALGSVEGLVGVKFRNNVTKIIDSIKAIKADIRKAK